jgi:hypothetical protein
MKARIKVLTSRSNGWGNERRKEALRQYIVGWVNYFKLADMEKLLKQVDECYRRRLRMVIWKQWKRIKTKLTNLIKLGNGRTQGRATGTWLIALYLLRPSPQRNYVKQDSHFSPTNTKRFESKLKEPPYSERYVGWCERKVGK